MAKNFVHLHVHSEYSLLDGLSKIDKMLDHIKENDMDAVALTDHGVMYGAIDFYKSAKKKGVKPIVGMEAYTTNIDHRKKPERGKYKNFHLLLLAKNETGYKNLMKLTTIGHLEGFYYKPRFDKDTLKKYSEGIICTSACAQGEVAQALIENDYKKARSIAKWFLDVFKDDYYLEVQRHFYGEYAKKADNDQIRTELLEMDDNEKTINEGVTKLSRDLAIPLVATNDSHYIKKEDAEAQDALLCIATGKNVDDIKRLRFIDTTTFYLASPEEMYENFSDLLDAVKNTVQLADKCDLEISTLGKWYFPDFDLPKKKKPEKYLEEVTYKKVGERYDKTTKEIKERIEHELEIINNKGYATYFLIMMAMANWCEENGIVTNTRGSAAGSIVSYILGITTVDPLKYYLPFERFLNPYRPSPPDIDLDVPDTAREDVIEYMADTYGSDKVAQICTFGRMLSRASVRDVARVLGYPYDVGDKIAKMIPPPKQGFPVDIPKALNMSSELKEAYENDNDTKKILDLAAQIEGNARHVSIHAAAVVVSPSELTDFTPLQRDPSGDRAITQYEMHASEDVGLIKFDILGIRNLAILSDAVDMVKKTEGVEVDIRNIPLNDKTTFEMLGSGATMGVFQLSSSGMTKYLIDLQPERIEDLMAMVALYRPGPMSVIPEYIKRKENPDLVEYLDPRMEEYLEASYGLIVYQDDLLFTALKLAGYNWEEADKFRKAVGKKIPEVMAAQKEKFVNGIIENGQTKEFAETLWKLFEPFQAYGFNKAHAASYGMVAYQTAYMKANYPAEYMCSLMTAEANDKEKIAQAVSECRRMGIKVLEPDVNKSETGFTISEDNDSLNNKAIRFGLNAIKNVGEAAVQAILGERDNGEFNSFADFLSRVDNRKVNKRVLESMIKVGALSQFGNRATLLESMEEIRSRVSRSKSDSQRGLFSSDEIKKSMNTATDKTLTEIKEFDDIELQRLERELLGFSLSAKPIEELLEPLSPMATHKIGDINGDQVNQVVKVAAVVSEIREITTKRSGKKMAFVKALDMTGTIDLVVFPGIYKDTLANWVDNTPILIEGKVDSREDSNSILVDSVNTKDTLNSEDNRLFIKIPNDTSPEVLRKLKELLLDNPGDNKVCIIFEGNNRKRIDLKVTINWTKKLAGEISGLLSKKDSVDPEQQTDKT